MAGEQKVKVSACFCLWCLVLYVLAERTILDFGQRDVVLVSRFIVVVLLQRCGEFEGDLNSRCLFGYLWETRSYTLRNEMQEY